MRNPAYTQSLEGWFGPHREGLQKYGLALVAKGLDDPSPLVRLGAIRALERLPAADRWRYLAKRLKDPVRAVRIRVAANLDDVPTDKLVPDERQVLAAAMAEYIQSLRFNFDRPGAHVEYGLHELKQDHPKAAEKAYRQALKLAPYFPQAIINLSDLYRRTGRDGEGEQMLRDALKQAPDFAAAHYALGLLLIRQHDIDAAVQELAQAARLAPDVTQYVYVHAIALQATGQISRALHVLEENHKRHPSDRNTLAALVSYHTKAGHAGKAAQYLEKLQALEENR